MLRNLVVENLSVSIVGSGNSIKIDKDVFIKNLYIHISSSHCQVSIGEASTFEDSFISLGEDGNYCNIGKDCMFAMQTGILTSDFHPIIDLKSNYRINYAITDVGGVVIGDHVWVGLGALLLKNIKIGNNSVIGARALVVKDVPEHTICAGNPAKNIRNNIDWRRDGFFLSNYSAVNMTTSSIKKDDKIKSYLESFDDLGYMRGWAFVDEIESCGQEIFIEVKNQYEEKTLVYKAVVFPRGDVAEAFGDKKYLWSGFECRIEDRNNIEFINLIIKNDNYCKYKRLN